MSAKKVAKPAKDTIYIDVEDEITAIIDKLHKSEAKVVAFVLPKRAATMQSVVNLKLLKRAADNVKKNIVLITSDHGVLPLAGVVGLHVAKTLQSKPAVPSVSKPDTEAITINSEIEGSEAPEDPNIDPHAPIGKLAGEEETIEVTDQKEITDDKKPKEKKAKNRKLSVPNFDKFRLKLILAVVLLVLLVGGWYLANVVLPKATITIKTDTSQVNTSVAFDAKSDLKDPNIETNQLPALKKELKKSSVEKLPTTGKRDDGSKATGTMTITNCGTDTVVLPAGTVFSGSANFISDASVSIPKSSYSFTPGGFVCDKNGTKPVAVTAQNGGASYNLSARSYQIQNGPTNVTAAGSNMAGGTSKLVSIVAPADIEAAKQQALDKLSQSTNPELRKLFSGEQMVGIEASLENAPPTTTSTPEVSKEATEVEVTVNVTFAMYGVKRDQLTQIIEKEAKKQIDVSRQSVQNTGIDQADIRITDRPAAGSFKVALQTVVTAGPQLDAEGIKKDVAGKKRSVTQQSIESRPGITDVQIKYSPFWVVSTPKATSHINIIFTESNAEDN